MSEVGTLLHIDESEKSFTINRVQDVEPFLERNKYLQTVEQKSDWGRHIADIPFVFIEKWLREEWDRGNVNIKFLDPEFDKICERKLRDPDWKFLRTDMAALQTGWSAR